MEKSMNLRLFAFDFTLLTEYCYLFVTRNNKERVNSYKYRVFQGFSLFFPQMRPEIIKKAVVELKAEEITILDEVKKQSSATIASMSESLGISKNQLQKMLNAMEEKKLIKREGPVYQSVS